MKDDFEPGLTTERLDEIYAVVKEDLRPLLQRIYDEGSAIDVSCIEGKFEVEKLRTLCFDVAKEMVVACCEDAVSCLVASAS